LRANLTQEIKDTLFGHKREGAREKYAISQATVIDAYNKAFQFLTVNHGTQARKDIETMRDQVREMRNNNDKTLKNLNQIIEQQQKQMEQLKLEGKENKQKLDLIFSFVSKWMPTAEQQLKNLDMAKAEFEESQKSLKSKAEELHKLAENNKGV
jgi:flagellar biosynthesis chaperone FliJ